MASSGVEKSLVEALQAGVEAMRSQNQLEPIYAICIGWNEERQALGSCDATCINPEVFDAIGPDLARALEGALKARAETMRRQRAAVKA